MPKCNIMTGYLYRLPTYDGLSTSSAWMGTPSRSNLAKVLPGGRCLQRQPVQKSCVVPIAIGVITHLSQIWAFYGRESLRRVAAPQPSVAQKFGSTALSLARFRSHECNSRLNLSTRTMQARFTGYLYTIYTGGGEELDTASTTPACVWPADSSSW
jgi:hypothetical protein